MKTIRKVVITLILIGGLILILNFLLTGNKINSNSTISKPPLQKLSTVETKPLPRKVPAPIAEASDEIWEHWFEGQSEQIGHLTDDPLATQKQLQEIAESIPNERLDWLRKRAKNEKINTDQRILAVEYLSLNKNVATLDALEDIALSPIDESLTPALKNESIVIKAAAIEGFVSKEIFKDQAIIKLNNIAKKTDEKFLIDRAQRSLWFLRGAAEKPEEQDSKALKKLLESTPTHK